MQTSKEENVLKYYVLCNKLKTLIRTGWKNWNVKTPRLESVAEHIYSTQMLAIAMKSEYDYNIDLCKVLKMLAIHETEEILIGDLTYLDISAENKAKIGHVAVEQIFSTLINNQEYKDLIFEFDTRKTKEAQFAYFCDKLEADLQARIYDLNGCVDRNSVDNNKEYQQDKKVKGLIDSGLSFGQMWIKFGQDRYHYDNNFMAVSQTAFEKDILKLDDLSNKQ